MKLSCAIMAFCVLFSSCSSNKSGCPTNGKNVGAEKLLSGDPKHSKDVKAAKKAGKFKGARY